MKSLVKITVLVSFLILTSCYTNKKERQVQYMADTDMYFPVAFDTYSEDNFFKDSATVRLPVAGTIMRGGPIPYEYPDTNDGLLAAKESLKSPLATNIGNDTIKKVSEKNLERGKYLYNIYCTSCHGANGEGQGPLVQNEKILGVPNYKDRDITEGSIYHVLMYGKGIMGSHSSQINAKERWQIAHYVEQLRNDLLKK